MSKPGGIVEAIMGNLTKFARVYTDVYAAMIAAGLPQEAAANEARNLAYLSVGPTSELQSQIRFGPHEGKA